MLPRSLALFALAGAAACGDPKPIPVAMPTSAEARAFFGLSPGSCWRYSFPDATGIALFANVSVKGPDTRAISGHTSYVLSYALESAPNQPTEYTFDTETAPDIRLLRYVDGIGQMRTTKNYDTDPRPLWASFKYTTGTTVDFASPVFEVAATTPQIINFGGMPMPGMVEDHKWVVLTTGATEMVVDHEKKPQMAYKLSYTRGPPNETAIFYLIPGYGFAKFNNFDKKPHQVCAARLCDASGACTGAPSCDTLACP